jgi:hypothetical protein
MQAHTENDAQKLVQADDQALPTTIENLSDEVYALAPPAVKNRMLAELVGRVYATAPLVEKSRLVAHLMKPLGILSLVAVANGVFASIRFRGASNHFPMGVDDVRNVQASDVIALTSYAQQVSMEAVNGLAHILATSPAMMSSAAALLLLQILMRQARKRRANDVGTAADDLS